MSTDFSQDIADMHHKFGVNNWVNDKLIQGDTEILRQFLKFRVKTQIAEEVQELNDALEANDAEGVVDALIDLIVFSVGTLDSMEVNAALAWTEVMDANMVKSPGVKPNRPNPFGLPDLIKPEGWQEPSHANNLGILPTLFSEE